MDLSSATREPVGYTANDMARFFHSIPHFDISFQPISNAFNPYSQQYQQALLLMAAVPVLWLVLWVVIYMVYFFCFCLKQKKHRGEKAVKKVQLEKWFSFFFAIISITLLAASVFGSEIIHKGLQTAQTKLGHLADDSDDAKLQSAIFSHSVDTLRNPTASFLKGAFETARQLDEESRPYMIQKSELLIQSLERIKDLMKSDIQKVLIRGSLQTDFNSVMQYEPYRRIGTGGLTSFIILVLAMALCAAGCKSKCCMIGSLIAIMMALMVTWLTVGVYVIAVVGASDFCVDPHGFLNNTLSQTDESRQLWDYYAVCHERNPFSEALVHMQTALHSASSSLNSMLEHSSLLGDYITQNITTAQSNITQMKIQLLEFSASTDCTTKHRIITDVFHSICDVSWWGAVGVFGAFSLTGLFTIALVFSYHIAERSTTTRRAYIEVDSQEQFNGREQNNRSDNPLYYRFSQISTTEQDNNTNIVTSPTAANRHSPPPAYGNHNEFYSTYGQAGTMDSNTRVNVNDLNRNSNSFRS